MKEIVPTNAALRAVEKEPLPRSVVLMDRYLNGWMEMMEAKHPDHDMRRKVEVSNIDRFFFDGGGMVHKDEPKTEITVEGVGTFATFLRQADFVVPNLTRVIEDGDFGEKFGPHVWAPGRWHSLMVTVEVGRQVGEHFQAQALLRNDEIAEVWDHMERDVGGSGMVIMPSRAVIEHRHNDPLKKE